MKITCVTIDCHDPEKVATFWNEAPGWGGIAVATDGSGAVRRPAEGGTFLEFIRVPEAKIVKNRVHLGCNAETLDGLDAEIERLVSLDAAIAWEEDFRPTSLPSIATSCFAIPRATNSAWVPERRHGDPSSLRASTTPGRHRALVPPGTVEVARLRGRRYERYHGHSHADQMCLIENRP